MTTELSRILSQVADGVMSADQAAACIEQLSAQTAEPYGYVLKTGHGAAFRENLAGVEPDFVKHWVRVYTDPPVIQTEQPSLSDATLPAPFFYYRANPDGSVAWAEDCVSPYPDYDDDDNCNDEPYHSGKAYSAEQVRALLAQRQDSDTPAIGEQCVSSSGPIGCYRVRCHLGKVCAANGAPKQ